MPSLNQVQLSSDKTLCVYDEAVMVVTDEGTGPDVPCPHFVKVEMQEGCWGVDIPSCDDGQTGWFTLGNWMDEFAIEGGYEIIGNIYENPELLN